MEELIESISDDIREALEGVFLKHGGKLYINHWVMLCGLGSLDISLDEDDEEDLNNSVVMLSPKRQPSYIADGLVSQVYND